MPDNAGSSAQVVLDVFVHRDTVRARFVGISDNDGAAVKAPSNVASFRTNRTHKSVMIKQRIVVGDGKSAVGVWATFDARRDTTTIWSTRSNRAGRIVRTGLVLVKLATSTGTLTTEY